MATDLSRYQSARAQTTTWLTPPHVYKALGHFDPDPCGEALRSCNLRGSLVEFNRAGSRGWECG